MADMASGANVDSMLNSIISESVWGSCNSGHELEDWKMHSPEPSRNPPTPAHVTYGEYLEEIAKVDRVTRKHLKSHFTSLVAPETASSFVLLQQAMTDNSTSPPSMYHLVPSFFYFLDVLQHRGIEFRLVFRTFGVDTEPVMKEFNNFCDGKHHLSQPNTNHSSRRIAEGGIGVLRRTGEGARDVKLTLRSGQVLEGAACIGEFISASSETLILQDDFEWWRDHQESDESGKLLLLDTNDENVTQIFFDDNIERNRSHIVDVRNENFDPVPFDLTKDRVLRRVYPFGAITDLQYYVKEFDEICSLQRERHNM